MKNKVKLIVNPFIRIAGGQALIWGFLGLIVSTLLCWISGYHYHGLLHFGPAPNPAWWCYLAEHLIVWLIPALLFYLGGLFLSHSRIRVIDVLGTVLFAQLPLLGMNLISLLPAMRMMSQMNMNMSPEEMLAQPYFILAMILTLLGITKKKKPSLIMSGLLSVLYLYIFVLIQLETFALLAGSLGLFIILAMVMYFSKKIDWFNE